MPGQGVQRKRSLSQPINLTPPHQLQASTSTTTVASMPTGQTELAHRPVFDAFIVKERGSLASRINGKQNDPFVMRSSSTDDQIDTPTLRPQRVQSAWSVSSQTMSLRENGGSPATAPSNGGPSRNSPDNLQHAKMMSVDLHSSSLIFSPPNTVVETNRPFTQQGFGERYREPKKAPGDVSLTGPRLICFLEKASRKLPEAKCEGVNMRLRKLQASVNDNKLSDGCIKKLNFVVDSIDRGQYDEAFTYFEQMMELFPEETQYWSQGVRLLIIELRRNPSRVSSASGR